MEAVNIFDYEMLAHTHMEGSAWHYYASGSDDEVTLRANRAAFERIRLRPRMLVDVSSCETVTTVLGAPVRMPILIAPTAFHCLAHPDGECATAAAAGKAGTLMVASTSSTRSLEDIARAASGSLWFQLYLHDRQSAQRLVKRAEAAGYRALVVTVDSPRWGHKERSIRSDFRLPSHLYKANFSSEDIIDDAYVNVTWESLAWLRSLTSLPIILKGILTAEDAEIAVQHGIEGIIVSNHGGRQLDGVEASVEALPEIVAAVDGHCEVYVDGGIRRGTDVLKALALGARAVLVGRPILWGLAANGAEGVRHVLEILHKELELAMILAGRPNIESIDRSLLKMDNMLETLNSSGKMDNMLETDNASEDMASARLKTESASSDKTQTSGTILITAPYEDEWLQRLQTRYPGFQIIHSAGTIPDDLWQEMEILYTSFATPLPSREEEQWSGNTERHSLFMPEELSGKTLAIVGYGSIGRQIARLAKTFEIRVLAMQRGSNHRASGFQFPAVGDPQGSLPDSYYTPDQLHMLLRESDVVLIAVPLTAKTVGMFDRAAFAAMKPTAFLVNIARGDMCDESALIHALTEKQIAGAALDVFHQEPLPAHHPLWQLPNVFISPHTGGLTPQYDERAATIFEENMRRYVTGTPLLNVVDKAQGY